MMVALLCEQINKFDVCHLLQNTEEYDSLQNSTVCNVPGNKGLSTIH